MPEDKDKDLNACQTKKELNAHQTKVGEQIESLVKSIFLLSGMALTISIGLFNSPIALKLCAATKFALKISWSSFFASIAVLIISLSMIVIENYRFGSEWINLSSCNSSNAANRSKCSFVKPIEILLFIGIIFFLVGMSSLAWAAVNILNAS